MFRFLLLGALLGEVKSASYEEHKRRDGVQVFQSSRHGREVMWGRCGAWFRQMKACILEDLTCDDHRSDGPAGADVEVQLGNLPFSEEHPTYLQWWAARKSEEDYDALTHPEDAAVYDNMFQAYPRYSDPDFNGGNVPVSPQGEATIRFRAPATYRMGEDVRLPHIHLRICSSGRQFSIILGRKDKVQLTANGPVAKSECNSEENRISVLGYRRLTTAPMWPADRVRAPAAHETQDLDLDPLEFSPVFQCLSAGLFYDHVEGDCVAVCPEQTVVVRGQCVLPPLVRNSFSTMWHLQICGCDEKCWADKRNTTLHRLRLEIADHLDIALHEVHELDLSFVEPGVNGMSSLARLHVRITSPRHGAAPGAMQLRGLLGDLERSSQVLAMLVLDIKEVSVWDMGFLHRRAADSQPDAYERYYQDLDVVKHSREQVEEEAVSLDPSDLWVPAVLLATLAAAGAVALALRSGKTARSPLQRLASPLAPVEDPPLFAGAGPLRTASPPAAELRKAAPSPVELYLTSIYVRALRQVPA